MLPIVRLLILATVASAITFCFRQSLAALSLSSGTTRPAAQIAVDERIFGRPRQTKSAAGAADSGLPSDFDWVAYSANYGLTLRSLEQATEHYLRQEPRKVHRRLRVILRYNVTGGLCNQLIDHLAHLTLAAALGAEAVLPQAYCRNGTYADNYWKTYPHNWFHVPADSLLDVQHLAQRLSSHNNILQQDESAVSSDHQALAVLDESDRQFGRFRTLDELSALARDAVIAAAEKHLAATGIVPDVQLNVHIGLLLLRLASCRGLPRSIALGLRPAPPLRRRVDDLLATLATQAPPAFNGVHLRLEQDSDYVPLMGGEEVLWLTYLRYMRVVGFNEFTPCYVASGMLSYMNEKDFGDTVVQRLLVERVCSRVLWKEALLPSEDFTGLHSEALAMLDFGVLVHSRLFVGFGMSSYSWFVREYRCLFGNSLGTSGLIDSTRVQDGNPESQIDAGASFTNHTEQCQQSETLGTSLVFFGGI